MSGAVTAAPVRPSPSRGIPVLASRSVRTSSSSCSRRICDDSREAERLSDRSTDLSALSQGLQNGPSEASLVEALRTQESTVRAELKGNPAEHPRIAPWREAYRRFGARPLDFRSSMEALVRRVVRGDAIPSINALVDIGNLMSLH